MLSTKDVETLPLTILKMRIDEEEEILNQLKKIYKLRYKLATGTDCDMPPTMDEVAELLRANISCKNNDCTCRQGYGLCGQCNDASVKLLERIHDSH